MLVSLEISMLILFQKQEPPCLLRCCFVSLPVYRQNPLHPVSQMETLHFHSFPPISTVLFLQFLRRNGSSHPPYASSFSIFASMIKASYYCRKLVDRETFCSPCGHFLQDLNHLYLDCLASEPLCKSIFLTLQSAPWRVAQRLGLCKVPLLFHPSEKAG